MIPCSRSRGATVAGRVARLDENTISSACPWRRAVSAGADVLADHVLDERDPERGGVVVGPRDDHGADERARHGDHHEEDAAREQPEEHDEPEDAADPAVAAAVALVLALVARAAAVAAGPVVAVAVVAGVVLLVARPATAPDAHASSRDRRASSSSWRMTLAASRSIRAR